MELEGRKIAPGQKPFLIAEIAQAHDGSLGFAHSYIDLAADIGVDAIKFQTHIAHAETTPLEEFRVKFSYEDKTRYDYWQRMEFTAEQWAGLFEHARKVGLVPLSSGFSAEAIEILNNLDMAAWKIASGEITNFPFLKDVCQSGKPVWLSSGMSSLQETTKAVEYVSSFGNPLAVFQCTSKYPTPLEEVGLNVLEQYRSAFKCPVGLSDHSGNPYPAIAALAQGADLLELHLCFDKFQFGPDTVASLTPEQFRQVVEARDAIHKMLSNPVDKDALSDQLAPMKKLFNKSLALVKDLPAGTILKASDLTTKKPGTGISPERMSDYFGKTLSRNVSSKELLSDDDFCELS